MKAQINLVHAMLRRWYYYQELKELSTLALVIFSGWFLFIYGLTIARWLFSETGAIYLAFFMASLVIGIAIKIYYRIMVIKYYEKDTRIRLFENKEL